MLWTLLLAACRQGAPAPDSSVPAHTGADGTTVYDVRGRLLEIRQGGQEALIAHEAIPGRMAAMTMPFAVQTPSELEDLAPGDAIAFRYEVVGASSWITGMARLNEDEAARLQLAEAPRYTEPSEASLYGLDATWTNQEGQEVNLAALQGRPVVVSMVFTHCGYACPRIVHDLKQLDARLSQTMQNRVQYVLVSLDPERDTPAVLRRFAGNYNLDLNRWTLLRGEAEQVRLLAALLGVRYREQADGQFAHTSLITILNEHGEIVHQQKGLGGNATAAAQALEDLLAATL